MLDRSAWITAGLMAALCLFAWRTTAAQTAGPDGGAISFTSEDGGNTYEEDFDGVPSDAGPNPFVQGDQPFATLPGWYADREVGDPELRGGPGDSNFSGVYSLGEGAEDRALGTVAGTPDGTAEDPAGPGAYAFGVRLRNDTNFIITRAQIDFTLERWRETGLPDPVACYVRIGDPNGTGFDLAAPNPEGASWLPLTSLDLRPIPATSNDEQDRPVDGNEETWAVSGNLTEVGINLALGAEVWIGWRDPNIADPDEPPVGQMNGWGNRDQALAIDDLTITVGTDSPVIEVLNGNNVVSNGQTFTVTQDSTVAEALDLEIEVVDPQDDNVEVSTTISNFTDQGFDLTQWETAGPVPSPVEFQPATGTFTQTTTHEIAITASDGQNETVFRITLRVIPPLAVGDVMIVGARSDTPVGFAFVSWIDLPGEFELRFTTDAYDTMSGNFTGDGQTITWTAPFLGLKAGTVVTISDSGGSAFADAGNVAGTISNMSNDGDQITVFQGELMNPLNRQLLFALNWANPGWLTSGAPDANRSYLPPGLSGQSGNLDLGTARGTQDNAQFIGPRGSAKLLSIYRLRVLNSANWALTNAGGSMSLDSTDFVVLSAIGSATTGTAGCTAGAPAITLWLLALLGLIGICHRRGR